MASAHDTSTPYASEDERVWAEATALVSWFTEPETGVRQAGSVWQWYADGQLNTCHNALDRHVVAGRGGSTALIWESAMTGDRETYTYAELLRQVEACAALLIDLGVGVGDRVLIYMPMIPEAVVGMLACARIGAIHSVVFGGFAARELASRIEDARPTVVLTASCGLEPGRVIEYKPIVDEALAAAEHQVRGVVVKQRRQRPANLAGARDLDWDEEVEVRVGKSVPCAILASTDPLYILYTSGTTGRPKGVVRDNGGHAVSLAWSMQNIFGIQAGDAWWAASDIGWVVGHSYIVYGPLLVGAATVLYEGKPVGTPDAGTFWRICERNSVRGLFTAPTALRAIRRADPDALQLAGRSLSLRALFVAGERLDAATAAWAHQILGIPVVDNWWQTETGWPITARRRTDWAGGELDGASVPMPGYGVAILGRGSEPLGEDEEGAICIAAPLPPGASTQVWNDDERFHAEYLSQYPGYYCSGDSGFRDDEGAIHVLGRIDDVINVAGHRLSSGTLEGIIATHASVADCAVIGVHDELKGEVPHAVVVLKDDALAHDVLAAELIALVRAQFGAVASLRDVHVVTALPKTRSGKILRRTIRELLAGKASGVPATIEDPAVIDTLRSEMRAEEVHWVDQGESNGPYRQS